MPLYREYFAPWVDRYGFPGNKMRDGSLEFGDSAQRLGMIYCFQNWSGSEVTSHDVNHDPFAGGIKWYNTFIKDEPRRHWDDSKWPGQPGTMSRDNATPMIVGHAEIARAWFWLLLKRFGFFWNVRNIAGVRKKIPIPDLAGPVTWGAIFRSAGWWWFCPIFAITDLFLLLTAIIRVISSRLNPKHTSDDLNAILLLEQADRTYKTPFGWLANKIYFRWGSRHALRSYFRPRKKYTPPPIHILYDHLLKDKWKNFETWDQAKARGLNWERDDG